MVKVCTCDFKTPHTEKRAVSFPAKHWPKESVLTVSFLSGTEDQRNRVKTVAAEWQRYANIRFDFVERVGKIRVSFRPDDGAWSYIGTDALDIRSLDEATMNLGWLDADTILHEFGHALGLGHEHQNPKGGIKWNEAAVIRDLSGPPNYWNEETIRWNVIERYSKDETNGTEVDRLSIMMYGFPASWTLDGFSAPNNLTLSATDKAYIESVYPFPKQGDKAAKVREVFPKYTDFAWNSKAGIVYFCRYLGIETTGTKSDMLKRIYNAVYL